MVTLIIEGAVSNDNVGWVPLGLFPLLLLRTKHDQRQLAIRLPDFIFLHNLLCVGRHLFCPLVVPGFGTLYVIDLVFGIVRIGVGRRTLFLLFFMNDAATSHDIEASLVLSDDLTILMFLEADIFLFEVFLGWFIALID